jgi:hypothetical protein
MPGILWNRFVSAQRRSPIVADMTVKTGDSNKSKQGAASAQSNQWHAVAIRPKGESCDAAQACRTGRFLAAEAPRLPLEDCSTSDTCSCIYKHLADRRAQPRRQDERDGLRRNSKVAQERRAGRDRRSND